MIENTCVTVHVVLSLLFVIVPFEINTVGM